VASTKGLVEAVNRYPRAAALATWLIAFFLPPYVQYPRRNPWAATSEALSCSLANRSVEVVWPSLLLHVTIYYSLYQALIRGRSRAFQLVTALVYLYVAFLQSTAFTPTHGLVVLTSNLVVSIILALLWLRGGGPGVEGSPPRLLLGLALFAYVAPLARTSLSAPPWWWMWERALGGAPLFAVPAIALDAVAGYGAVAYCLYTPLALYLAFRFKPVPEYAVRLAGFTGAAYAIIIIVRTAMAVAGGLTGFGAFMAAWNSLLHFPLLVASIYAVSADY